MARREVFVYPRIPNRRFSKQLRITPSVKSMQIPATPFGQTGRTLQDAAHRAADRLFFWLLAAHLPLVYALAPLHGTWGVALGIGTPIVAVACLATWLLPGRFVSRAAVAVVLMLLSGVLIHQTAGMIETHFHIFASLAFLLLYRDWRVPLIGAAVVAVHHFGIDVLQRSGLPVHVFNHTGGIQVVAVHAAWVVFETAILVYMSIILAAETRQAAALMAMAERMGEGDLAARAEGGKGAMGDAVAALNQGAGRLSDSISTVRARAREVSGVAGQLSTAAHHTTQATGGVAGALAQVASGAQQQVRDTEAVAVALDVLGGSIDGVTARVAEASAKSAHAMAVAQSASAVVTQAMESMEQIRASVLEAAEQIAEVRGYGERIGRITAVITAMAEQTNLLALNAAIEAARAGENGRGFAVVADEVRKLATQSGASAQEAAQLVAGAQRVTARTVATVERGATQAREGAARAADAGSALGEILDVVKSTAHDLGSISEQARDISDASRAALVAAGLSDRAAFMGASQANAAAAGHAASAVEQINASMKQVGSYAEELAEIARGLDREFSRFQTAGAPAAQPHAAELAAV
jgi:methyl-accepting chemotaxis protein